MSREINEQLHKDIEGLVNNWCDRRSFKALRHILQGWPLVSGLTDDWGQLLEALKNVRDFAHNELKHEEKLTLNDLINTVTKIVYHC